MRSRLFVPVIIVFFGGVFSVPGAADDKIDFFRRFLDESPTISPQSSNLAQDWLREVVASAPTTAGKPTTKRVDGRRPVLVAVRPSPIATPSTTPVEKVLKPITKPIMLDTPSAPPTPSSEKTTEADEAPIARVAARPLKTIMQQPKPPMHQPEPPVTTTSEMDEVKSSAEIKRIEANVKQRVDTLQVQLEAEEKRLQSKLAEFNSKREAALAKSDEATLKRIEKAEQSAVSNYEQRVQRLLSTALPSSQAMPIASQEQPATRSINRTNARTGTRSTPNQQPIERPVATKQPSKLTRPAWARPKPAVPTGSQPRYQTAPSQQRTSSPSAAAKQPTKQPVKKRFRLWPFK